MAFVLLSGGAVLHYGERHIWAHALARVAGDAWMMCGLDSASLRFGHANGARERLVSLTLQLRFA